MSFDELSAYFERLEAAAGRLEAYRLLGELFYKADPDEAAEIAYLCEARLLPAFANPEVGMGERMAAAAIAAATGKKPQKISALQRKRKHGVEEMAREFPLALIAFDLLYANGKDYTNEEYESRRAALER